MIPEEAFLDNLVAIWLPKMSRGQEEYLLIQAPFDHDEPEIPFATLQVISEENLNQLEETNITYEGQEVQQDVDVTIRLNFFGKGAITTAKRFSKRLEYPGMVERMDAANTYWRSSGNVTNLTGLIKTNFQERARLDVVIGIRTRDFDEDILPIENFEIVTIHPVIIVLKVPVISEAP